MKMRVRLGGFIYCEACFFFLVAIFSFPFSLFRSSSILGKSGSMYFYSKGKKGKLEREREKLKEVLFYFGV